MLGNCERTVILHFFTVSFKHASGIDLLTLEFYDRIGKLVKLVDFLYHHHHHLLATCKLNYSINNYVRARRPPRNHLRLIGESFNQWEEMAHVNKRSLHKARLMIMYRALQILEEAMGIVGH